MTPLRITLLATLFIPLIFWEGFLFPFLTPKIFLFKTLVTLAAVFFAVAMWKGEAVRVGVLRHPLSWVPWLLLLVLIITSLFGVDPAHSFWSTFERGEGISMLIYTTTFFYLILVTFKENDWKKFWTFVSIVGTLLALHAVFQKMGLRLALPEGFSDGRVGGLIGNAAFLASFLVMSFFATLFSVHRRTGKIRILFFLAGALQIFAIFLTETRGAFLGLVAGLGVFFLFLSFEKSVHRYAGRIGLLLGALLLSLILFAPGILRETGVPVLERLGNISLTDATTASRLFVWKYTLSASLERPLTGYGLENLEYVNSRSFDPTYLVEDWFDRTHNSYLDYLAQGGVFAFLLYLILVCGALFLAYKHRKKDSREGMILLSLLVAYAVGNFFVFDTISTTIIFLGLFAFLLSKEAPDEWGTHPFLLYKGIAGAIAFVLLFVPLVLSPVRANSALADSYKYQIVDIDRSLLSAERARNISAFSELEVSYQLYDSYFNRLENNISPEERIRVYDFTTAFMRHAVEKYPWSARLPIYLGHIIESRPEGTPLPEDFVSLLDKATELSPLRPQPYYMRANIAISNSQKLSSDEEKKQVVMEAVRELEEYVSKVPFYSEAHTILATILLGIGEKEKANEIFQKAEDAYKGGAGNAKRMIAYLLSAGRIGEAEKYFEEYLRDDTKNYIYWFDLSYVYYVNGKIDKTVDIFNMLQRESPETLSRNSLFVDTVLKQFEVK